jgi:Mlc titration factor MtfA (ptsG expression regulator)
MPGDTIYISNQTGQPGSYIVTDIGDTLQLPDSFYGTGGYLGWTLRQEQMRKEEKERKSDSSGLFLPLLMIFFILIGITRTNKIPALDWNLKKRKKQAAARVDEKGIQYDNWLSKYNPYYKSLTTENKKHFLRRTAEFIQAKEFRFHSMVEEEYIPVLISGAAIQMTFGLKNYLMDYFPVIHVIRKEYTLDINKETYYGHVSRNGIYISWNSFLEGYEDYADSVNVGLHEMAHAVSYDVFLGRQDRNDEEFKQRLKGYAHQAKPVFRAMRKGASHILDEYAATNFDEFWAVCVESFFENAEEFQRTMPDLYLSVCELLNQDPLRPEKIINQEMAGIAT